jgi:transcriptional regulator with XRE-family HTH domain
MGRKYTKLSEQIRRAVRESGWTQYRIAKRAKLDKGTMSRFMSGKMGLAMESLDQLGKVLRLNVVVDEKDAREGGKEKK